MMSPKLPPGNFWNGYLSTWKPRLQPMNRSTSLIHQLKFETQWKCKCSYISTDLLSTCKGNPSICTPLTTPLNPPLTRSCHFNRQVCVHVHWHIPQTWMLYLCVWQCVESRWWLIQRRKYVRTFLDLVQILEDVVSCLARNNLRKVRLVTLGLILPGFSTYDGVIWTCPIKLQHVQLLGWPTSALALVGMLIGDNWSHVEVRTSIYGKCWPHSNPYHCKKWKVALTIFLVILVAPEWYRY